MPSGFASLDTGFPNLKGMDSSDQQIKAVEDYLVQLLENLRYMLRNIGPENLNTTEMVQWLGETISEPIKIAIKNVEEQIETEIQVAADGLMIEVRKEYAPEWTTNTPYKVNDVVRVTTTVGDDDLLAFYRCLEDHTSSGATKPPSSKWASVTDTTVLYSRFDITADEIRSEVNRATGIEGNLSNSISSVDQKADEIRTEVSQVTEITANPWAASTSYAVGAYVTVTTGSTTAYYRCNQAHTSSNANKPGTTGGADYWIPIPAQNGMLKQMSSIDQKADSIKAQVTDGQGNYTVLNLKSDGLHVGNASGTTTINGSSIKVRSDANTTLDALTAKENNVTVIDGGKIKTGSIEAAQIKANTITAHEISTDYAYAGTIEANKITTNNAKIQAAQIDTIKANQILSGSVATGYITADYVAVGAELDAPVIKGGEFYGQWFDVMPEKDVSDQYVVNSTGGFNIYGYWSHTLYHLLKIQYDGTGYVPTIAITSPAQAEINFWSDYNINIGRATFTNDIVLTYGKSYGSSLPASGTTGQLFFVI